jgi:hypothetical protein
MKLTQPWLEQIIQEEFQKMLFEAGCPPGMTAQGSQCVGQPAADKKTTITQVDTQAAAANAPKVGGGLADLQFATDEAGKTKRVGGTVGGTAALGLVAKASNLLAKGLGKAGADLTDPNKRTTGDTKIVQVDSPAAAAKI